MKIRNGFVSNSSSSSFIINKDALSKNQINKIKNHMYFGKKLGIYEFLSDERDNWDVIETDTEIHLATFMDNFPMYDFLISIGVSEEDIKEESDRRD